MMREENAETDIRNNKVKEGWLVKRSRVLKEWKKRWMVLTRTHLYSFEQRAVYRTPTEKIPLKEVSTIKSFYKNQYERPHVFRIESDDTYFYLSAQDHQDKWAWMTAVEKMTESTANPTAQDSQNLIRETLRMSTAVRQSALIPRKTTISENGEAPAILKKLRLRAESRVVAVQCDAKPRPQTMKVERMQPVVWQGQGTGTSGNGNQGGERSAEIVERIVERVVEIRVPV
jgi:hypothetical protein